MRVILAMVLTVAAGCSGPDAGPGGGGGGALATRGCQAVPAGGIVAMDNAARARAGLAPLAADPVLARVAAGHACAMAAGNFFAHRDRDGRSPGDRVRAARVESCLTAENIAFGQRDAAEVHAAWLASPGHRANILRPDLTRAGMAGAVAPGGDGLVRWVAVYVRPCA